MDVDQLQDLKKVRAGLLWGVTFLWSSFPPLSWRSFPPWTFTCPLFIHYQVVVAALEKKGILDRLKVRVGLSLHSISLPPFAPLSMAPLAPSPPSHSMLHLISFDAQAELRSSVFSIIDDEDDKKGVSSACSCSPPPHHAALPPPPPPPPLLLPLSPSLPHPRHLLQACPPGARTRASRASSAPPRAWSSSPPRASSSPTADSSSRSR
jgi:hypothetical protein